MRLIRTERRVFPGPARSLADAEHRAEVAQYLADLTRPFGTEPDLELSGHSYGEMASELVAAVVLATEPVDLLVLAFSIHDMWPGRATAAYLSHVCPGTPLSFAICDQGSAAPFTGLRVIRDYSPPRALLISVEQAALPYKSSATPPAEHRGVAMLYGNGDGDDNAGSRVAALRQHPDVAPDTVAGLVSRDITELSAGRRNVRVVLGDALATAWPGHPDHTEVPAGQPATGVWWHLADELPDSTDLVLAADYDPDLRYLCVAGIERT
ncbi:MAG: hypothetical protein ACJ72N_05250 [Labedaea sp.]